MVELWRCDWRRCPPLFGEFLQLRVDLCGPNKVGLECFWEVFAIEGVGGFVSAVESYELLAENSQLTSCDKIG